MSHVVASGVIITDIDCLKAAVARVPGLHWKENQKTWAWYGKWVGDYDAADAAYKLGIDTKDYGKCEHAIKVDGSNYEIGVMKRKDGKGYSLVFDFFGSNGKKIQQMVGDGCEKLMVEYQRAYVTRFANLENMNMTWKETKDEVLFEMEVSNV